jgi:hypothetical protein
MDIGDRESDGEIERKREREREREVLFCAYKILRREAG